MEFQDSADAVVSALRKIIRAIDIQSRKLTKKYGLTGPQLIVLKEIDKNPNRQISDIARNVSLSQATVTSILDRLEQQGFAVRQRNSKDKRKVTILLKEKAAEVLRSNPQLLQEEFSQRFEKLEDWEKSMILSALQRLASLMNAEEIESPPVLATGPISASSQEVSRYLKEDNQLL